MLDKTVSILALLCYVSPAQGETRTGRQDGDTWIHEHHGFRIERPTSKWRFAENTGSTGYQLSIRFEGKPKIECSMRVAPAQEATADAVQDKAIEQVGASSGYSSLRRIEKRVAGQDAPGIRVHFAAGDGTTYRIEQLYLVENGVRYVFQCHAQVDDFRTHTEAFTAARASVALLPASEGVRAERRLAALAARCGSEIEWATDWNDAARQAREARKFVLVIVRSYPGFQIPDRIRPGPLSDRDVVELIDERCVTLWLEKGMAAPFRSQKSYGMSGSTFGQALLLVTPDGEVLHETQAIHPVAVYDFLRTSTANHPELPGSPMPDDDDPLGRAERHLRRGEHAEAERLLEKSRDDRVHRLRASLHRRQRRGDAALAALGAALGAAGGGSAEIALEEVEVLMAMGRDDDARRALARARRADPGDPEQAEILFWDGVLAQRAGATDALAAWHTLTTAHPESRWAWRAAAVMQAARMIPIPRLRTEWPDEAVVAELRDSRPERLHLRHLRTMERQALAFLLSGQREDGSWISPSEIASRRDAPNPFTDAVTAVGGRSALERRSEAGCLAAAERALGYLLDSHQRAKQIPSERSFMDYSVWSNTFVLWFLADCLDQDVGDAEKLRETAAELVEELGTQQKPGGGWSYYVTRNLGDGGGGSPQSISFVTAPVVMALLRARAVGVTVPESVTSSALDCLEAMRNDNGAFIYLWQPGADDAVKKTRLPGAAGRAPLCELALLRGGRGSVERLRDGLEIFREHRRDLARQLGKVLMHAGPDGQGCHYLMFDYGFAAEAVSELPKKQRAAHRRWLLDLLLDARSVEGGFRGTQINGWAYGTAMALSALRDLDPAR